MHSIISINFLSLAHVHITLCDKHIDLSIDTVG